MQASFLFEPVTLWRLFEGVLITLHISVISIFIAIFGGLLMGFLMISKKIFVRFLCRFYLEGIRIVPILVWLFIFYFSFSAIVGLDISGKTASIIVFSLWGIAEMGDLTRGALTSVSTHQIQSAKALGLTPFLLFTFIVFPQAIVRLIPASINLFTRMIKTTSLVALIGVVDLLKVGQQLIEVNIFKVPNASFWVYGMIFIVYFLLCYPLSIVSKKLEYKISSSKGGDVSGTRG